MQAEQLLATSLGGIRRTMSRTIATESTAPNSVADPVMGRIHSSYREMMLHDGYGEMKVEVKILKRGQKEVIVHFGKQYRFVVDALVDDRNS